MSVAPLISAGPLDRVEPVVAGNGRLLDEQHGVVVVSETHVGRPDCFRPTRPGAGRCQRHDR